MTLDEDTEAQLCIVASEKAMLELRAELQADDDIDKRLVEFEAPELPGALGEPITITILIFVGAGIAGGGLAEIGRRSMSAILNKVSHWRSKDASVHFSIRGSDGSNKPITREEAERLLQSKSD